MRARKIYLFLAMILGVYTTCLHAHGVSGTASRGGIVIAASYDSGDPMSYSKVTIFAPGVKLSFQGGRTDRNGRFCFFPDGPGQWKVLIDDGIGHRMSLPVFVDEGLNMLPESADAHIPIHMKNVERAFMGVCLIFGATGIVYGLRARRTMKQTGSIHRARGEPAG